MHRDFTFYQPNRSWVERIRDALKVFVVPSSIPLKLSVTFFRASNVQIIELLIQLKMKPIVFLLNIRDI